MIKNLIMPLTKAKIAFYTLIWLMILLIAGTIAQKYIGLHQAQNMFFSSWIIWLGYIPLPGGLPTLGLLAVSLTAKLFFASPWSLKNSGIIITHIGALLLLLGGLVTYLYSQEGNMIIYEGQSSNFFSDYYDENKRTILPFEIELIDFEKKFHPATNMPKSYKSEIILHENGTQWRSVIQMNEPLRYRGYTFYQSSFIVEEDGREATVFAVVKNIGRMFPYISSIIMCIGLLVHALIRVPKLIGKKLLLVGICATCILPANAMANNYDFTEFASIPILDEGRVKPLDSFAITYLEIISGKDSFEQMSAIEWLAELTMNPDIAYHRRIFNIPNVNIVDALGLERRKNHHYSYSEIENSFYTRKDVWKPLFNMPEEQMSLLQRQLVILFRKTQLFAEISRSLSLLFPDFKISDAKLAKLLGVEPDSPVHFLKLHAKRDLIGEMSKELLKKSAKEDYKITDQDAAIAELVFNMNKIDSDKNSSIFRIIPPQWEDSLDNAWFSPWAIGQAGQGSPASARFLELWAELVQAYRTKNYAKWSELAAKIKASSLDMAKTATKKKSLDKALSLEVSFNNIKPFTISFISYSLAFVLIFASFMIRPAFLARIAFILVIIGLGFHMMGMGMRMFIMHRPPVTNLYETVIFVGFIAALTGILLEIAKNNALGIIIASSSGAILHFIGIKFDMDGDTMGMLAAVLDTNFWLTAHVATISIGYGTALVASILGHIYLLRRIFKSGSDRALSELFRNMRAIVIIALLFTVMGTILGGIWADQSWGRFWGWDPKENGALLIILWLTLVIHGHFAKIIGELGYAACMVCTNIIVAGAWFGVNLLNVGLHSYGFTNNTAFSFITFSLAELFFALGAYSLLKIKLRHNIKT